MVSTQLAPQRVGVAPPQALTQEKTPEAYLQSGVAPEQTVQQLSQLEGCERSASQPLAMAPSQLAWLVEQATPQLLPLQVGVPLAGTGQGAHEAPQVAMSPLLTQAPPQS
jgi:hypothetical protein